MYGPIYCGPWVAILRGCGIRKGFDFPGIGIMNGIDFHNFGIRNGTDCILFRKIA